MAKPTRGVSRPPLERMIHLHRQLQAGGFPNARKLAELLEVSPKTIRRDLEFMRDRLYLPIEYNPLQYGFYYSKPITSFPNIEVSEAELFALLVAQKALKHYRGTSFERPLHTAFDKIGAGIGGSVGFERDALDAVISFRGIGMTVADLDVFETLSKAAITAKEVIFEHKKLTFPEYYERRVRPYHLACIDNQWYLFGYDLDRDQVRTFALPRIRKAKIVGPKFERPMGFHISQYLDGAFGVFRGDGKYHVRIQFDAFASEFITERQWHASQQIKLLTGVNEEGIELSMVLGSLDEVARWILSWASHARVLEPENLVKMITGSAEAVLRQYIDQNSG